MAKGSGGAGRSGAAKPVSSYVPPPMRVGFGKENMPAFSAIPIRNASDLNWWGGGDKPAAEQSVGASVGDLEVFVKHNVSQGTFSAKIVSSEYGKGWGVYTTDSYTNLEAAKDWVNDIYEHIPVGR